MDVPSLTTLRDYVARGWVTAFDQDGLVVFNYTNRTVYARQWDEVTLQARGLVLDATTGAVVARPWPKFFNHDEPETVARDGFGSAEPDEVTVKLDGSLGIGYRDRTGALRFATRGRFDSAQAVAAERLWARDHAGRAWPEDVTPLVEIVDPATKVLLDYPWSGLVLLGARTHEGDDFGRSDVEALARDLDMRAVEYVTLDTAALRSAAATLDHTVEGFVARFGTGPSSLRVKYKSAAYLALARLANGITDRFVADCWVADLRLPPEVPEETRQWFDDQVTALEAEADALRDEITALHDTLRASHPDRKGFALEARAHGKRMALLMAQYTGAPVDLRTFVYRRRFGNYPRPVDFGAIKRGRTTE